MNAEKGSFEKYKFEFEKYKFEQESILQQKDVDFQKRQLWLNNEQKAVESQKMSMSQKDAQIENERLKIKEETSKINNKYGKIEMEAAKISNKASIQREEEYIKELMKNFNDLGINLNNDIRCKSEEYAKRYNAARSLLDEISVRVSNINKYDKYRSFIASQSPMSTTLTFGGKQKDC